MTIPSSIFQESLYPFTSIEKFFPSFDNEISWPELKNKILNGEKKKYILAMFAYPSGNLHLGHVRNFLYVDLLSRYYRQEGYTVLNPFGWDSFGLPAENAAKEASIDPKIWTEKNINTMKETIKEMGFNVDWSMELATHKPEYYHQQQKIFIDIFKKGLCYKKKGLVFWDPKENTVLSKEQVIDGKGWRSGAEVEMKIMDQWYFKITHYVQELINDLTTLDHWPDDIKTMQKNWMNPTRGFTIDFLLDDGNIIKTFSTKPQMLYGCTFLALSLTHEITIELSEKDENINNFIKKSLMTIDDKNYQGIFTGLYAINPINNEKIPVYIASYVNNHFGTGSVYGVPYHNLNDYHFAQLNKIPMKQVLEADVLITNGIMINSDQWNNKTDEEAVKFIENNLDKWLFINSYTTYNLHDWCFARQRYWGCPIPLINCNSCGIIPADISENPVILPENVDFSLDGNPLDNHPTWKYVKCPKCHNSSLRETNTMDTFVDSAWYFYRYISNDCTNPIDKEMVDKSMAIDIYIGGREHAVSHLLYCRFFTKVLRDLGYITLNEPVKQLNNQGFVCMATYFDTVDKKYIFPQEVQWKSSNENHMNKENYDKDKKMLMFYGDHPVIKGPVQKMSKSKKNIIDPYTIKNIYGTDVLRFTMISDNPIGINIEIKEDSFTGAYRFLNEVWLLGITLKIYKGDGQIPGESIEKANGFLSKAKLHLENLQYNLLAVDCRQLITLLTSWVENNYNDGLILDYFFNFLYFFNIICPSIGKSFQYYLFNNEIFKLKIYDTKVEWNDIKWGIMVNNKFMTNLELNKNLTENQIQDLIIEFYKQHSENIIKKIVIIHKKNMINLIV